MFEKCSNTKLHENPSIGIIYIRGSVHRNSRLKKSNEMKQYADIYLLLNYSTCFGPPSRPSSGVHKTVVAASGTDHTCWEASFFRRGVGPTVPHQSLFGHVWGSWLPKQYDLYERLHLHFYVLPDHERDGRPKHVE